MSRFACVVAALVLAGGPACAVERPSLCTARETALFSCSVGNRIVSLCGSADLSETSGTLQYRFGRRGAVELAYPDKPTAARKAFTRGSHMDAGSAGGFVRFSKGALTYTLYDLIVHGQGDVDGLLVHRGATKISDRRCKAFALYPHERKRLEALELPADPRRLYLELE